MERPSPFEPPVGGLSLYVHVPFCERKCNYCAFESGTAAEGETDQWLALLEKELAWWWNRLGAVSLNTCYIGGGTPTVLTAGQWTRLCSLLERSFDFSRCLETAVEANPNSLLTDHLLTWKDWRVTRVSVGVQSFDEAELSMLGRLHTPLQAYNAISAALAAGFSVNADFMFGLPYQTLHNWARTLKDAVKSGVGHISLYQLSLEPDTPWAEMDPRILPDGCAQYRWAQWYLPRRGFAQYEVANFAKKGQESKHNLNYWREGAYLGVGPGASGYIGGWRYKNIGLLSEYAARIEAGKMPAAAGERLSLEQRSREAAVLALRTTEGIDRERYVNDYGTKALAEIIEKLIDMPRDLTEIDDERIALTPKGMRVANRIWVELI